MHVSWNTQNRTCGRCAMKTPTMAVEFLVVHTDRITLAKSPPHTSPRGWQPTPHLKPELDQFDHETQNGVLCCDRGHRGFPPVRRGDVHEGTVCASKQFKLVNVGRSMFKLRLSVSYKTLLPIMRLATIPQPRMRTQLCCMTQRRRQ